ncbi:MAG: LysM peptidoglycan-binding domain-containing protein, partial [Alcanivoracaceae bacterium]|nr:LysM peptidoglycan-binding domain-containing protein [Alcanivoracaceae bacterium]
NLTIGSVAAIDVLRVNIDSTTTNQAGALLEGAIAAQNLKIEAGNGIIVANAVEATAADLLLDAQGGDLAINATVDAGGNASLLASANVTQSATGDVTVGGTLDVNAQGGDITMTDGAISAATGNLRYLATGDIRLASLNGANVLVNAGGSIIDNGDADRDVIALTAQLIAGVDVGASGDSLDTDVNVLAASATTGGVRINELTDLEIGSVAAIDVERVNIDSTTTTQSGSLLEGIQAAQNIRVAAENIDVSREVRSTGGDIRLQARNGLIEQSDDLGAVIAEAGDIEMFADNGNILLRLVSAEGNQVTLTASEQILNNNGAQTNVIADVLLASARDAIGVTAGYFTDPDSDQRLTTEVDSRIEVTLSESGTVAIDNTSTGGDVDVLFTLPLADVDNGSSVWVRNSEGLNASGLVFATESNGVEFNGNLQLLAVDGDLSLNEALIGDANDVNLVAQWMRLEAARGAFLNGDGSRFQQVGDGLGLTADDLVLITGGDLGVSATVDRLNVIGTGLYQVAVGGTPGTGGENADLDLQLSRRDIALVDEAIRFETIVIDRQTDPAPSWIADLDNFFLGLGATGWQENVFGLFTTGTARVISLRQDDGVSTTHDGSIRFVDNVEAGQLSLPADLTIEVRAGEFGTDYAGTIYVDSGVTFVAQNVGTPLTGSAAIFGNVLVDGAVEVQEDRSIELQGRGGDIIIDSDQSAAGRVLLSPGLGFDVIFTNAATFTVTQGVGAEGDLVILSARNVVMDPDTAIIADGSVLIGADNITGDVVLAEGGSAVQGDVILYNVTANANGNGVGDVVVYTTGEAAGDTYSFDFGNGVETYEITGRIVLGRQDVFDNLITELTNDPLFLDNPANIPPPAVQGVNVRLIAADSIQSGWDVDYDAGLLPEQELVHVVATGNMELRAINGLVGGTVAPQGQEGLTAAEQPLRVVVGDLMRLGAGDYDRYATSVHLVGTAERFAEIRLTPGLITFNTWQIGGNLEPKFVSGTAADASAYVMAGYGELERRAAQAGVALSHGTDNALQLISFAPGQPEPLTALWVVDDTPFGNEVLDKPEQEPFRSFEVRTGDTLWDLAEEFLGDADRWQEIWWLTPDIQNPDLIEPGQKINLEREQLELLQQIQQEEEAQAAP